MNCASLYTLLVLSTFAITLNAAAANRELSVARHIMAIAD